MTALSRGNRERSGSSTDEGVWGIDKSRFCGILGIEGMKAIESIVGILGMVVLVTRFGIICGGPSLDGY